MQLHVRRSAAVTAAALLSAMVVGPGTPASAAAPSPHPRPAAPRAAMWPAPGSVAPSVPRLAWKPCAGSKNKRLRCATALVPLDYRHPTGPQIRLDLSKLPASKPRLRVGSLFVNPGGPGGLATASLRRFNDDLGPSVTDRFDLVAMNPRGVGDSSLARCWSTSQAPTPEDDFPQTPAQIRARLAYTAFEATACNRTGRPIIDHMSTGDVARDMDLIRQAVGDRALTYYGISYGTVLGQTYAALFPSKVRAVAIDGVVDAVAWTTGRGRSARTVPVSARTQAGAGADETLRAAFAACRAAGPRRCPNSRTVTQEWDWLIARLRTGPITSAGDTVTFSSLTDEVSQSLYAPDEYRDMMQRIHAVYEAAKGGTPVPRAAAKREPRGLARPAGRPISPTAPQPDNAKWWDTFRREGVMCGDSLNPKDPQAWARHAAAATANGSWFTAAWTWQSALCARWPANNAGAYRGPFTVRPARPMLVFGNTHDPATPLSQAKIVAATSPGARLVTVDTYGHTISNSSRCASTHLRRYLLTGAMPTNDTTCRADKPLF